MIVDEISSEMDDFDANPSTVVDVDENPLNINDFCWSLGTHR